jgi:hypothetical protein
MMHGQQNVKNIYVVFVIMLMDYTNSVVKWQQQRQLKHNDCYTV